MLGNIRCNNTSYKRIMLIEPKYPFIKQLKVKNCSPECLTASIEIYIHLSYGIPWHPVVFIHISCKKVVLLIPWIKFPGLRLNG